MLNVKPTAFLATSEIENANDFRGQTGKNNLQS